MHLTQKLAAPDLFSITNKLNTLCFWFTLNSDKAEEKAVNRLAVVILT